ncbi:MAG: hypothetical protein DMD58_05600 [Gemmatimonadetes bacterium]|nr:MAG: hypothetical protein DMD58_05600 [Gemmatimonadota bacterium]
MRRITLLSLASLLVPFALTAQQVAPTAPHDSVRGAIRRVNTRARTLEVTTGVGFALRVVRLQVPAAIPITDRKGTQGAPINLAALKPGDVIRVSFGGRPTGFVAYTIERIGRMEAGVP